MHKSTSLASFLFGIKDNLQKRLRAGEADVAGGWEQK